MNPSTGLVKEEFGARSMVRTPETASAALIAKAQAEVNALYVMALQRPRDFDVVRKKILDECRRPLFAERAIYSLPRGDKPGRITGKPNRVEGLTVRFAETAIRLATNIRQQTQTTYDDEFKRIVNVSATDLEANVPYSRDIIVEKTVERRKLRDGQVALGKRLNSAGEEVFIVGCTDDELLQKEGALVSRVFRTLALRLIPADIIEEAEQVLASTKKDTRATDPTAARKRLLDSFAALGVPVDQLKAYVGHDCEHLNDDEREDLWALYSAIKEGEISWAEAFGEKTKAPEDRKGPPDAVVVPDGGHAQAKTVADRIAERKAKRERAKQAKAAATEAPKQATLPVEPAKREREPGED